MQKNENGPLLQAFMKINSKWIKDLNVRAKPSEVLKIGVSLHYLRLGKALSDMGPKA